MGPPEPPPARPCGESEGRQPPGWLKLFRHQYVDCLAGNRGKLSTWPFVLITNGCHKCTRVGQSELSK